MPNILFFRIGPLLLLWFKPIFTFLICEDDPIWVWDRTCVTGTDCHADSIIGLQPRLKCISKYHWHDKGCTCYDVCVHSRLGMFWVIIEDIRLYVGIMTCFFGSFGAMTVSHTDKMPIS